MNLTETIQKVADLKAQAAKIEQDAKDAATAIRAQAAELQRQIALDGAMLDAQKIELARSVLYVRGSYKSAGEDRASVVQDAITFFATGPTPYKDLRDRSFGTKSYDRWYGQRSDHPYGMGPRHGSIIFEIGLTKPARERDLTAEEIEAALYLLTRLEAVQQAEAQARQAA